MKFVVHPKLSREAKNGGLWDSLRDPLLIYLESANLCTDESPSPICATCKAPNTVFIFKGRASITNRSKTCQTRHKINYSVGR